jgi:hypothetical protein
MEPPKRGPRYPAFCGHQVFKYVYHCVQRKVSVTAVVKDSGRRGASRRKSRERAFTIGCKRKAGANVLFGEVRKVSQQLLMRHAACQILQYVRDRHACPPDARFAASLVWLNRDDLVVVHMLTLPSVVLQFNRRRRLTKTLSDVPPRGSQM